MLNFGTSCFSSSVAWSSIAADYNTYFPEDTNQLTIYLLTYIGNAVGTISIELLGAAVYTGTYQNPDWADAYERDNVGGLLGAILSSIGVFGKLLLIFFALSAVASLVPSMYSLSLFSQVIAPVFERIPRAFYTVIGTGIYLPVAVFTASRFNDLLASLLTVISYSTAIFIVIVFEDHLIFRRCSYKNYDFSIWDNRKVLPISLPAMLAGLVGVVGVVLGMSQTWFHGPISTAISKTSPDLGFILSGVTYPLFRCLELYFVKR
jgi:purine-cytosine permease-like protein